MDSTEITVATWNTEWAPTAGRRGPHVRERLADASADILVVTEGSSGLLPDGGYVVDAGNDWGYEDKPQRRKVLLRSCWPLTDVDRLTTGGGAGRVVTALATAPAGPIRILAVCIPWARAHVSTGRRDATAWSEHLDCLDQIEELAECFDPSTPTVVAGDFNQRIPRVLQPARVADRLAEVMGRWMIHTAGDVEHGPLIDHVASNLTCTGVRTWSGHVAELKLSDHSGVVCRLAPAGH